VEWNTGTEQVKIELGALEELALMIMKDFGEGSIDYRAVGYCLASAQCS
jgi:hypothetical protein